MPSRPSFRHVLIVIALTTVAPCLSAAGQLRLLTPTGFVSLKEGKQVDLGSRSAQALVEAVNADAYAVKLRDGTIVATFVAKTSPGGAPITTWGEYLANSLAKSPFANDAKIGPARTFLLDGVDCAVADVERVTNGVAFRERYYALPTGDRWVFVKLLAARDEFPSALRSVETAIDATRGLARSTQPDPVLAETGRARLGMVGGAMMAIALMWLWLRRSPAKRRAAKPNSHA
jgi:hypothetical protein